MPRRKKSVDLFQGAKSPEKKKGGAEESRPDPTVLTLHIVPDELEEDAELKAGRESAEKAALLLQACWRRRPRWSPHFSVEKLERFMATRPESAREVSKRERNRLMDMGLKVPTSLAYGECPSDQFELVLSRVAALREVAQGGCLYEGQMKGRLGGVFYDLGSGHGLLCHAAALHHDFTHAVGIEILPGLFDECLALERYFNMTVKSRLLKRIDRDPCAVTFASGDAVSLKWNPLPTVVFCHCSVWDESLMLRLAKRLALLPIGTFIITTTFSVPSTPVVSNGETIHFNVLERVTLAMPWGPVTAIIQQRRMTAQEEYEAGRAGK